jgi:8-oxo-dGTP diphosphatase
MGRLEQGINITRYSVIPRVLVFITIADGQGQDVLLLRGAPDKKIWPNRLNGVGGHVESAEDIYSAALREVREETGLTVAKLILRGIVNIEAGDNQGIMMFVFTAQAASRAVTSGPEGALEWWPCEELPQQDLVEDLRTVIPMVLAMDDHDPPYSARYWYDDQDQLQMAIYH